MPCYEAPVIQPIELNEPAFHQKEGPKKAASEVSYNVDRNIQPEGSIVNPSASVSSLKKRALTPPYIPEKGLLQTWPKFGFNALSKEGERNLRSLPGRDKRDPLLEKTVTEESPNESPP